MSLPVSEELLSAYLDGELSPSEHELVERLLDELPALREQLAELSQVGEKLRALRREPAPGTLHRDVMSALTSRSVLKSDSPARPLVARDVAKAAGALAACLAVGFSVWLANRPGAETGPNAASEVVAIHEADDSATGVVGMSAAPQPMLAVAEAPEANGLAAAVTAATQPGRTMMHAPLAAAAPAMDKRAMGSAARKMASTEETIRDRLLTPGYVPNAGELLSYLDVVDDQPVVVEYTVADVQQALGQVQVLLSRNGIRAVGESKAPVQVEGDGTVAVYLEANDQELADVLDGLQSLPLVMVVDEAETLASLPRMRRQSLQTRPFSSAAMKQGLAADRKLMAEAVVRPPAPPVAERIDDPAAYGGGNRLGLKDVEKPAGQINESFMLRSVAQAGADPQGASAKSSEQSSFQLALPHAEELRSVLNSRRDDGRDLTREKGQSAGGALGGGAVADADRLPETAEKQAQAGRRRVVIFLQSDATPASPAVETSPTLEKQ